MEQKPNIGKILSSEENLRDAIHIAIVPVIAAHKMAPASHVIHNNNECRKIGHETVGGYESYAPYKYPEEELKRAGYDVLVFVPSLDEEDGLVTCGNVILGGSTLKTDGSIMKIEGQPSFRQ